ncbi:MAG: hypothetical protein MI739_14715 [Bacteroidales bacterium]|nr:hypothetical protein [Bacteroidales bacterium]
MTNLEKLTDLYQQRINTFELKKEKLKKHLVLISISRFVFFILFIISFVYSVKQFSLVLLGLIFLSLIIFIGLVIRYIRQTSILKHYQNLIEINTNEKNSLKNQYSVFYDGNQYIDREHEFSYDLDLFGKGSIFQYINRTVTQVGSDLLASSFTKINTDRNEILEKQQGISELSEKLDWRQNYLATGHNYKITSDDSLFINKWLDKASYFITKKIFRFLVVALPTVTILSFILFISGTVHYSAFTSLAIIQLFIASIFLRRTNLEQNMISKRIGILKNYSSLIKLIDQETFNSKLFIDLKTELHTENYNAQEAFRKLIKIIDAFDSRLNIFLGVILNATLMWDMYSVIRLERWKQKYGYNVKKWVKVIAQFDMYCSVSNFAYNNPGYIYPEISDNCVMEAKELGHPLISSKKRVNNDFTINELGKIDIITGANMAGKSTFLRTIGVNLILALNGMPVCAKKYCFKIVNLFSGMRTADSLNENESYFYAELKRLKNIINKLNQGEPTLVLLDEILKGTNSVDKAKGSWKFVEHLIKLQATGIIATHDLTLCKIKDRYPQNITNKCFEVEIDKQNIIFDYKLKSGVTKNMNASILMEQMGLFDN